MLVWVLLFAETGRSFVIVNILGGVSLVAVLNHAQIVS
jgi:hypothetical protein